MNFRYDPRAGRMVGRKTTLVYDKRELERLGAVVPTARNIDPGTAYVPERDVWEVRSNAKRAGIDMVRLSGYSPEVGGHLYRFEKTTVMEGRGATEVHLYTGTAAAETVERITQGRDDYNFNVAYFNPEGRFFWFRNSKGYIHVLQPKKLKSSISGHVGLYLIDYLITDDNMTKEVGRYEFENSQDMKEWLEKQYHFEMNALKEDNRDSDFGGHLYRFKRTAVFENKNKVTTGNGHMKRLNENSKITLTLGQLRRLVRESEEVKHKYVFKIMDPGDPPNEDGHYDDRGGIYTVTRFCTDEEAQEVAHHGHVQVEFAYRDGKRFEELESDYEPPEEDF